MVQEINSIMIKTHQVWLGLIKRITFRNFLSLNFRQRTRDGIKCTAVLHGVVSWSVYGIFYTFPLTKTSCRGGFEKIWKSLEVRSTWAFNLSSYVVTRELLKRVNCSFQFRQLSTHYTEFYGDFMPFSSLFVDLMDVLHESCPFRSLAIVRPFVVWSETSWTVRQHSTELYLRSPTKKYLC